MPPPMAMGLSRYILNSTIPRSNVGTLTLVLSRQRRYAATNSKVPATVSATNANLTTQQVRSHSVLNDGSLNGGMPLLPPAAPSSGTPGQVKPQDSPLAVLPTWNILRSLMITTASSNPVLLQLGLALLSKFAKPPNAFFDPSKNPLFGLALQTTMYPQFCAGATEEEISKTAKELRSYGFSGIILNYAKEIVIPKEAKSDPRNHKISGEEYAQCVKTEVEPWAKGQMDTVRYAMKGDFVAVKFTGAGRLVLGALARQETPPPEIASALEAICSKAKERGVRVMFDAEQFSLQRGIDKWVMDLMRHFNKSASEAFIYNTYQCYLKSTPATLSAHLAQAQNERFSLGAKLVRGAYMGTDPPEIFWSSKEATDKCYDDMLTALLNREWGHGLEGSGEFPDVGLCLATHNAESVRLAQEIAERGIKTDLSIAQLQGMADEISCELLPKNNEVPQAVKAFKYITWGTMSECMQYLWRRGQENQDAASRTMHTRVAMWHEMLRRLGLRQ